MNFNELHLRLLDHLRDLVRRGELTERGLARMTGVSQPHIHNVLKGKRVLSADKTDEILRQLRIDLLDLMLPDDLLQWRDRR